MKKAIVTLTASILGLIIGCTSLSSCDQDNLYPVENYEPTQFELLFSDCSDHLDKLSYRRDLYIYGDNESKDSHINSLYGELTSTYLFVPKAESLNETLELRFPIILSLDDLDTIPSIELKHDETLLEPSVLVQCYRDLDKYSLDDFYKYREEISICDDLTIFNYFSYRNDTEKTQKLGLVINDFDFDNGLFLIEQGNVALNRKSVNLEITAEVKKGETCAFFVQGDIENSALDDTYNNDKFVHQHSTISFADYLALAQEKYHVSPMKWKKAIVDAKIHREFNNFGIQETTINSFIKKPHLVILSYQLNIEAIGMMTLTLKRPVYLGMTNSYYHRYSLHLSYNPYIAYDFDINVAWNYTYINLSESAYERFVPVSTSNNNVVHGTPQSNYQYQVMIDYGFYLEFSLGENVPLSEYTVYEKYESSDENIYAAIFVGIALFITAGAMIAVIVSYFVRYRTGGKKYEK